MLDLGTSIVVQWLSFHIFHAGGRGSMQSERSRSHMPQLRVRVLQIKITHAAAKKNKMYHKCNKDQRSHVRLSQINKYVFF